MVGCSIDGMLEVVDVAMRLVEANNHVMFKSAVPELLSVRKMGAKPKIVPRQNHTLIVGILFTVGFGNNLGFFR